MKRTLTCSQEHWQPLPTAAATAARVTDAPRRLSRRSHERDASPMNEHVSSTARTYDSFYTYRDLGRKTSRCYLQIYESRGALPVVLVSEIAGCADPCVLYASGRIATQVWHQLLPQAREGVRVLAVHLHAYATSNCGQEFSELFLVTHRKQLKVVGRRRLTRTEAETLIGGLFSLSVETGD